MTIRPDGCEGEVKAVETRSGSVGGRQKVGYYLNGDCDVGDGQVGWLEKWFQTSNAAARLGQGEAKV